MLPGEIMKVTLRRAVMIRATAFFLTFIISLTAYSSYHVYFGWQAAFVASAAQGRTRVMKWMYMVGVDVNAPGCEKRQCLLPTVSAAWGGHDEALQFLLDHGGDVNKTGTFGITPLMIAAYCGSNSTVRLLLSRGADPNIATANGETALTFAKDKHRVETIRLLEEAGAR
jgi:hypothetical protein